MNRICFPTFMLAVIICFCGPVGIPAADTGSEAFEKTLGPFLKKYCLECHNSEEKRGNLDLEPYRSPESIIGSFRRWQHIIEFIRDGEMPPEDAVQPTPPEMTSAVRSIRTILLEEARKTSGDPGDIPPRRLSNREYNYAIEDLTGHRIDATTGFPPDPAGGEGFDNTGESLRMSPSLFRKLIRSSQIVSQHLVLKPDGLAFAPTAVNSYNERKALAEQAIIDFYERNAVDIPGYIEMAWRCRVQLRDGDSEQINRWANERDISGKYLARVMSTLDGLPEREGLFGSIRQSWSKLQSVEPGAEQPGELGKLVALIEQARSILNVPREQLIRSNAGNWPISHLAFRARTAERRDQFDSSTMTPRMLLRSKRISASGHENETLRFRITVEPLLAAESAQVMLREPVFSKNDRLPANDQQRKKEEVESLRSVMSDGTDRSLGSLLNNGREIPQDPESVLVMSDSTLGIAISGPARERMVGRFLVIPIELTGKHRGLASLKVTLLQERDGEFAEVDQAGLMDPTGELADSLQPAAEMFCQTFPNRFFYVDSGRGLAAGFHLVEGFFRDDRPLLNLVLDKSRTEEIDRLWEELDFLTMHAETLLRGFVWFERSEREVLHDRRFDFLRPEAPDLVSAETLGRFEKLYLDKLGIRREGDTLRPADPDDAQYQMVHGFFERIRNGLVEYQRKLIIAERQGLKDLEIFAEKAYGRKLTNDERLSFHEVHQQVLESGANPEQALRGTLTAILMSPDFYYQYSIPDQEQDVVRLSGLELARRLSFFLWSSIPDEELLKAVERGELDSDAGVWRQTERMLRDDRIERFAREFFGQWLRYRDFELTSPVNAAAFTGFDDELRHAFAEEPVRLLTDLIRNDHSVMELLTSDETFVNRRLAQHYGGSILTQYRALMDDSERNGKEPRWLKVKGLRSEGRGGLFGMAVTLCANSSGERTSPVKRGFWTAHHLLGQHFPPPPADVAELPASEKTADRTIRQLLADHVENRQCAMCHRHFDHLGLALEGFDPIGRKRTRDAAGRELDTRVEFGADFHGEGVPGLINYVQRERQEEFVRNLCRKFLGYALGRSVLLSDEPLLEKMREELGKSDHRIGTLFRLVVLSPQFQTKRGAGVRAEQ